MTKKNINRLLYEKFLKRDLNSVMLLLDQGASPLEKFDNGNSAYLQSAIDPNFISYLDVFACQFPQRLSREFNVSFDNGREGDGHLNTPLHFARDIQVVRKLLECETDIDIENWGGWSPLHLRLSDNPPNLDLIRVYLEHGASTLKKNKWGYCPIVTIYQLFLDEEQNVRRYLIEGKSLSLQMSQKRMKIFDETFQLINKYTSDWNLEKLEIELVRSIMSLSIDEIKSYIEIHSINVNCLSGKLLRVVSGSSRLDIVDLLLSLGARIDICGRLPYNNALAAAILKGSYEVFMRLVSAGTDIGSFSEGLGYLIKSAKFGGVDSGSKVKYIESLDLKVDLAATGVSSYSDSFDCLLVEGSEREIITLIGESVVLKGIDANRIRVEGRKGISWCVVAIPEMEHGSSVVADHIAELHLGRVAYFSNNDTSCIICLKLWICGKLIEYVNLNGVESKLSVISLSKKKKPAIETVHKYIKLLCDEWRIKFQNVEGGTKGHRSAQ